MYEFHPYYTKDGSVGLYSPEFNDIYHSATGALTEAYEKFILPSNIDFLLASKEEVKVLDICYGIGYNTKSFLNYIFEKLNKKISYSTDYYAPIYTNKKSTQKLNNNAPIHTDKVIQENVLPQSNYGAIYADNHFRRISITAIDNDKNLIFLSPFIKTGVKNFKKYNRDIPCKKVHKYLANNSDVNIAKINESINFLILNKLLKNTPEILTNSEFIKVLFNNANSPFLSNEIKGIYKYYINLITNNNPLDKLTAFLHNIYYRHLSNCYKRGLKPFDSIDVNIDFKFDDARKIIINDKNIYDLIFLDAFTPSKCPCLWSYEFFTELYKRLDTDGMLLTYSSSASIRSAMIEAGFFIGNIYNQREGKFTGTVAVKNKTLIKHQLSEFDLGLLKTRAGIFYRDENLTGLNEAIIAARNLEVKNSNLMSSSEYKKKFDT